MPSASLNELINNESIKVALKYTCASILSHPDGSHLIENGGVQYTPRLNASELISFCNENQVEFKKYWLKYGAFISSGGIKREQRVPEFSKFW